MPEAEENDAVREFVREMTEIQAALRAFVGYLMAGNSGVADAAQEVNMLLWEKREQFEAGSNFRAWAFTTARYVVMGQRRRMRKEGMLVFDPDLVETLADEWQTEPDGHERKLAALDTCLEKLCDADLNLLRARYSGHGEIERMAGTSESSAGGLRTRIFRLRAALKQCVQRELEIEGGLA